MPLLCRNTGARARSPFDPAPSTSVGSHDHTRQCHSCNRTLPVDHFRAHNALKKFRYMCRDCRTPKPYTKTKAPSAVAKAIVSNSNKVRIAANLNQASVLQQRKQRIQSGPSSASQQNDRSNAKNIAYVGVRARSDACRSTLPPNSNSNAPKPTSPRVITPVVSSLKFYQHQAPPGLAFSGPMDNTKNASMQRRFLVPPGVIRNKASDFPPLDKALEGGMFAHRPECLECSFKGIHCTYGAGVRNNGKSRDPKKGKCDFCIFANRKCRGNGYEGYRTEQVGAHTELVGVLDRLSAQVDTCIRAGEEDRSARVNAEKINRKWGEVNGKFITLSAQWMNYRARL